MRARERIAAERAARKRAEARRRILVAVASVTAVLAVVVALAAVKLTSTPARLVASESPASSVVVREVTTVPATVLTRVSPGQEITPLQAVKTSGPPLKIGGKPAIVFVSEESCPFCAAERWSLAVALSHFGIWSNLGTTTSSATDVYPDTATLSFRTAHYQSTELTLRTTELTDNAGRPLQAQTPLVARLIGTFDVPPYVNSADQSGAVPFLDIANRYVLAGAQYDPQVLAGLSAAQIASQLSNPASPVAAAIDGSAQVIVAAINQILHDQAGQADGSLWPADALDQVLPASAEALGDLRSGLGEDVRRQVEQQRAVQGRGELGGQDVQVGGAEAQLDEQGPDVLPRHGRLRSGRYPLPAVQRGAGDLAVPDQEVDPGAAVGDQAVQRRGARAERRGPGEDLLLELPLVVV
jgi:hypothetical protein